MLEEDNKKRILFTKSEKRLALLELAKGVSVDEIFEIVFKDSNLKSIDKTYASKLLFKWRNEMYKNKEVLNFINQNLDDEALKYEMDSVSSEFGEDEIMDFIDAQMKKAL